MQGMKPEFIMPSRWQHRPGTFDADIFRMINDPEIDEYRLNCFVFDPEDVVIDIGAHIGSFAWAARQRGADRIICFEPCQDNFELLKANVGSFAECQQLAVVGKKTHASIILTPSTTPANTGGWDLWGHNNYGPYDRCYLIEFDKILAPLESVAFLKLDCEGAEFPILLQSKQLGKVQNLACEYHERGPDTFHNAPIPDWAAVPGYQRWTGELLGIHLQVLGFEVEVVPDCENLGKIFARRR